MSSPEADLLMTVATTSAAPTTPAHSEVSTRAGGSAGGTSSPGGRAAPPISSRSALGSAGGSGEAPAQTPRVTSAIGLSPAAAAARNQAELPLPQVDATGLGDILAVSRPDMRPATTGSSQPPQGPDPRGPDQPGSGLPGGPSTLLPLGSFAILLAFVTLAAPGLGRRLQASPAIWRPVAFASPLERPG